MKAILAAAILSVSAAISQTALATNTVYQIQGNNCYADPAAGGAVTHYEPWGPAASTSSPATVWCPLVVPNLSYTAMNIEVAGYNRNASWGLGCTLYENAIDGSGSGWVGSNIIGSLNSGFQYGNNSGTGAPMGYNTFFSIQCNLPPLVQGQYSHLTSVYVTLTY